MTATLIPGKYENYNSLPIVKIRQHSNMDFYSRLEQILP